MKNITFYNNYRKYLLDLKKESGLSYLKFSKKLGFKTDSYIIEIIQGKKTIGRDSIVQIAKKLKFTRVEKAHWVLIVMENDTKIGRLR